MDFLGRYTIANSELLIIPNPLTWMSLSSPCLFLSVLHSGWFARGHGQTVCAAARLGSGLHAQ